VNKRTVRSLNRIHTTSLCLWLALFLTGPIQGGEMILYQEEIDLPEGGTTQRPVLLTETHRARFQAPDRWHMELTSTNQTVMFYDPAFGAGIMMRLWTESRDNSGDGFVSGWRERIEQRLQESELVGEFRAFGANAQGLGIDLEKPLGRTTRTSFRIALIPFDGGLAEFELRTTSLYATNYHRVFRHLVGSFSAERRQDGRGTTAGPGQGGAGE
jgi:hypothetical protein